jgi:AcrR family transcriptional regulator
VAEPSVSAQQPADDFRAADGRVPGRRGRATRQRLLECTADMLRVSTYRDVKVIDIAREAGTSPATFYQYFPDVETAILSLAEEMAVDGGRLSTLVREKSWRGRTGYETSVAVVDAFLDFWEQHRHVLRVVDLATDEGDQRFRQIRTRVLHEVTVALADVIGHFQEEGRQPRDIDPTATAGTLVSMLAHVAAHLYGFEFWGIRTRDLRRSMARQLYWGATGQKPPST